MTENIKQIKIEKIFPHPQNPRKNLGDLTELADSIRSKGILQNLTVVPKSNNEYTVIIGHRRLAAAKIAGLESVPCVITEMDEQDQAATMLLENMQRNDLTLVEQADGIQLVFDMGADMDYVQEKTGFSKSTIRSRLKLREFDRKKFVESQNRGGTLADYEKISKITDEKTRDKLLDAVGTANFNYELQKAVTKQKNEVQRTEIRKTLDKFAKHIADTTGKVYVQSYYLENTDTVIKIPDDAEKVGYYYTDNGTTNYITLYKDRIITDADIAKSEAEAAKKAKLDEQLSVLKSVSLTAFQCRKEFVLNFVKHDCSKCADVILKYVVTERITKTYFSYFCNAEFFVNLFSIPHNNDSYADDVLNFVKEKPFSAALAVFWYTNDSETRSYIAYDGKYRANKDLDSLYGILTELGYEMSDEEKSLQDGTHEMFVKENSDDL